MNATRDPTARLRAGLNPLLTSALAMSGHQHQPTTPLSAAAMHSPNAFSAGPTPVSAIQPYNPQEWIASPAAGPESFHGARQDPAASPPPPPPYSPPRSQRPPSMSFDSPSTTTPQAGRLAQPMQHSASTHRPSPEPQAATSFPPPPPVGGRGSSRERRFGLPGLGRRRDTDQATTPQETRPPAPSFPAAITSRVHPGPLSIQIPQTRIMSPDLSAGAGPPASRRAASTGAIGTPTSARSRSSSQVRWEPGMPLPPPPPGPPPSSRSIQRPMSTEPVISPPTRRPPPSGVTALGPVPPTPADWIETQNTQRQRSSPPPEETAAETSGIVNSNLGSNAGGDTAPTPASATTSTSASASAASSSASGLARARAVRGEKTLRERRNESRTRSHRDSIDASIAAAQPLSDIVIPPSGTVLRRMAVNKSTPRSGRSDGTPRTGDSVDRTESRNSTPKALSSALLSSAQPSSGQPSSSRTGTTTPPFSPRPGKSQGEPSASMVPKALPTPPPQSRSSSSQGKLVLETTPAPLSPSRPVTKQIVVSQTADQFSRATIERFQTFAQKEAAASDDAERVRLFAEFVVSESRIRRERYSTAIGAMGSEIFDLTRDLFRPMVARRESAVSQASESTPQSSEPTRSHRGSIGSVFGAQTSASSAPNSACVPLSPSGPPPNNLAFGNSNNYMPSLSPILSMSINDALEEGSSRGRPASRWWEADSVGNASGKIERSKRESKYMGVPKEAREALQWVDDPGSAGPSKRDSSNEYPAEKVGLHEVPEQTRTPQPRSAQLPSATLMSLSCPNTPNPDLLDVSRLVTLPPPYPRHHPAVNNSHPELAEIRSAVRAISDMAEIEATRARFVQNSDKVRAEASAAADKRGQTLRANLQVEISSGNMTYAEAATIESDARQDEHARVKELDKKDFDTFQTAVVAPLNELLTARIARATALLDDLRGRLGSETQRASPNLPQEEGDEQPELLEQLTLLKWVFEARETLHRAIYDLLSDRNDRYRDMILTPYRLAGNADKLAGATAFFEEDAAKRALAFADEVLQRTEAFRDVVEENVSRGVEVQLSAFWDIAPPLKRLLDKIPLDREGGGGGGRFAGAESGAVDSSGDEHRASHRSSKGAARSPVFGVQIPPAEFDENPSYVEHPLQYLFSLLLHAEKSTYQFIENQTNLLCLLHEVKEAVTTARAKVMEHGGAAAEEVEAMRRHEDARLTGDLKEKVRVVQDQWNSALGDCIVGVKERVGEWLLEEGGWDESLEDSGVGGPVA